MIEVSFTYTENGNIQEIAAEVREESVIAAMYRFQCSSGETEQLQEVDNIVITILQLLNGIIDYKDIEDKREFLKWLKYYEVFASDYDFIKFLVNSPYLETLKNIIKTCEFTLKNTCGSRLFEVLFLDSNEEPYVYNISNFRMKNILIKAPLPHKVRIDKKRLIVDDKYIYISKNCRHNMTLLNVPIGGSFIIDEYYLLVREKFEYSSVKTPIPDFHADMTLFEHCQNCGVNTRNVDDILQEISYCSSLNEIQYITEIIDEGPNMISKHRKIDYKILGEIMGYPMKRILKELDIQ